MYPGWRINANMRAFEVYTRRPVSKPRFGRKLLSSVVDTVATGTISGSWVGNLNTIPAGGKKMQRPPFPKDEGRGTLPTEATLRVKLEKNHPQGGVGERRGISVGAADYDEDNSCAELADRDMEMLVNITVILNSSYCV